MRSKVTSPRAQPSDDNEFKHMSALRSTCTSLIAYPIPRHSHIPLTLFHTVMFSSSNRPLEQSLRPPTHLLSHEGRDADCPPDPGVPPPLLGEAVSPAQRHLAHLIGPGVPAEGNGRIPPGVPHPSPAAPPCPAAIQASPSCHSVGRPPPSVLARRRKGRRRHHDRHRRHRHFSHLCLFPDLVATSQSPVLPAEFRLPKSRSFASSASDVAHLYQSVILDFSSSVSHPSFIFRQTQSPEKAGSHQIHSCSRSDGALRQTAAAASLRSALSLPPFLSASLAELSHSSSTHNLSLVLQHLSLSPSLSLTHLTQTLKDSL